MKNLQIKLIGLLLMSIMLGSACTKNFTEINTDPNNTPDALPQQLLAPALASVMYYNQIRNRTFNNELMQVTVNQSDAESAVFRYDFKDSYSDYLYNGWYAELTNFKDLYKISSEKLNYNRSYMGISLICQAWVFSMLTDSYGDLPFSQAIQGRDSLNLEPRFDTQKYIYEQLFQYLETADTLFNTESAINASSDPVFNGDIAKWQKFGNTLYLRLLMRVSGKKEVQDVVVSKIRQIVENPSTYPVMTSNDDAAVLRWTGAGPYTSPYVAVRAQDFRSPSICSFFIDHLVVWGDPRINVPEYGTVGVNRWGIAPVSGQFIGVKSGYQAGQGEAKGSYFYATDQTVSSLSPPAITLQTDPMTGIIMNYAELQFILAECAVNHWIDGDAGGFYTKGVESSITYWLPDWDVPVEQYLEEADMQWRPDLTKEEGLEMIGLQKYYALFLTDLQQWFEYRRTGHPVLPKGDGLKNGGVMPARMKYPIYIQATNPTHYKEAVAVQGSDEISTKVWWQRP